MLRSWRLGTAFGIGVYVHWSFLLLLALVIFSAPPGSALYLGAVMVTLFGCVVLHELGHALTARYFGIKTESITLYVIGGVARLEKMSDKPLEELLIAVAGPAVNVVIACLLLVALLVGVVVSPASIMAPPEMPPTDIGQFASQFLRDLLGLNLFLVVFNMIPAFPMDGGRVLRALLALRMGLLRATEIAVPVGAVVGLVAMSGFTLYFHSVMPLLIGLFVFVAGQQELYAVRMRARQAQKPLEVLPVVKPVMPPSGGPSPVLDLRPTVSVYAWDPKTGTWIREAGIRPLRVQLGNTD
jgi:Zn-dependent protease